MPPTRETSVFHVQPQRHVMPELVFFVQPSKEHRFRYRSEFKKGSHGQLKGRQTPDHGQNSGSNKSRCPVVHLLNYLGPQPVKLQVKFHTPDGCIQHIHKLVEGSCDIQNQPWIVERESHKLPNGTLEWRLDKISICYSGKEELDTFVSQNYPADRVHLTAGQKKNIENAGVLHVTALNDIGIICPPKTSDKILNSKDTQSGTLNIAHIDKVAGYATGKDEVTMLCSRIPKNLISKSNHDDNKVCVEFYEINEDGEKAWFQFAKLKYVHFGVAIIFDTPPYREVNIDEQVDVCVQLRTIDGKNCSEPRQFTYWPKEDECLARKRRKVSELDLQPGYIAVQQAYAPLTPVMAETFIQSIDLGTGEPQYIVVRSDEIEAEPNPDLVCSWAPQELNQEIDDILDANCAMMNENNDPVLGQTNLNFVDDLEEITKHLQFDSKTKAATSAKPEESIAEVDQAKPEEQKPPAVDSNTNGVQTATHPDKYIAYKLALHTAQCLHNFAKTGNVRVLLMSMRHLVALQDEQGDNAIHAAVIHSQSEAMENLVEVARTVAEYDILNMCNELKESPLHIAVQTGQVKAIKLLLYHGANPNVKDKKGNTPIHLAAQSKNVENLTALLDSKAYVTKYKKHAPDLNTLNFSGFSALHLAALNDSLSAIKSLWYAGCDVDVRDRTSGRTALHFAVERHHLEIVHFLLHQAGAETDIHMFNGNTPLHLACSQNHVDTVAVLMQAKADPYLENYERAENSDDDNDSSDAASPEDEDVRGLTSIDLASSEEIRSLLRGEAPLSSMSPTSAVMVQAKAVEVVEAVRHKSDLDKADPGTDSGIGLSGRGFSSSSPSSSGMRISDSQLHKKLTLSDILDTAMQARLAKFLDGPPDYNWRKVLVYLDMASVEKTLASHMSPTQGMLHYIQATELDLFGGILDALELYGAKDVLQEAKDKWEKRQEEEAYLDSKMRKMKL